MDATRPEEWRPVVGFEGRYEVSDQGRVRSLCRKRPRVMQRQRHPDGYWMVKLSVAGGGRTVRIHVLILAAFVGPRPSPVHDVRHLNGDPTDCRLINLAYGTKSQNQLDSVEHGTHHEARKTACPQGHPFDSANTRIDTAGKRRCRACDTARNWAKRGLPKYLS